jgi:hypothetical protein
MKTKNIIIVALLTFTLSLTSCFDDPGTSILFEAAFVEFDAAGTASGSRTYTYLRVNDGQPKDAGFKLLFSGQPRSSDISVTYEIVAATTTAIENVHYTVGSKTVTVPANTNVVDLPFQILVDNINAGEVLSIDLNITSADVSIHPDLGSAVHRIQISCPSDLAGTFDVQVTGSGPWGCTNSLTTTNTWTAQGGGVYSTDDFSFGAFAACYGAGATLPGGTLRINDICGNISPSGVSRWGEVYTFSNGSTSGADFSFTWVNDYGEGGDVILTRQDGNNWPNLTTN